MGTESPPRTLTVHELDRLQNASWSYFWHEANEANGLISDSTQMRDVVSIAAVGLALSLYPVAVERKFLDRRSALKRTLTTLRFFAESPHGPEPNATGHHGFYYHFLDLKSGRRVWNSEISTIDTAFLLCGMLAAAEYFQDETAQAAEIRRLALELYRRADWRWVLRGRRIGHGWRPESGFIPYDWQGYCEALALYLLALGSPTFPIPPECYRAWTEGYRWRSVYDVEYLHAGPLFTHQLSHVWVDFRGIQDDFMRERGLDYFENSRRASLIQQEYAIRNPHGFAGYGKWSWGLTACDGPGFTTAPVDGVRRTFYGYIARGVPDGPDDGTLAPWAVAASLPFAPEIVLPTLAHFVDIKLELPDCYGFATTFNPTFPYEQRHERGWISPRHLGLNQGPVALMIENYRSGMIWDLMRRCEPIVRGLRRAGFTGGWLDAATPTGRAGKAE